jgi:hypothetical protein
VAPKRISTRLHDLIETRRRDRRWGLGMLVVGLIVLLDSPYPIPFPLVGLPSVIVSAVLVFWAVYRLYRGCGLPLREVAIYLAMKGGEASRTEILEFLEGEEGKGDQLFEILEKKEIATLATHNLEMVEERDVIPEGLVVLLPGGRKLVKGLIEGPGKEG